MSTDINITVQASNQTDAQLVSHHIGQYLTATGFTDVTVLPTEPMKFQEHTNQNETLSAISRLNPQLLGYQVNIDPCVQGQWGGNPTMPDGPDEDYSFFINVLLLTHVL